VTRTRAAFAELRAFFSGDRPIGDSAVPPIVFIAVNAVTGLRWAAAAAIATAFVFMLFRVRKGKPIIYALGGVAGVGFAAAIALRSDQAEGYFLPGIISNGIYAAAALVSIAVRKPLMAFTSWLFHRWPLRWYWRNDVRPAYSEVTVLWGLFFAARGWLQFQLFEDANVAALGIVKVLTGTPAVVVLLIVTYVYGTWRLDRLGGPTAAGFSMGSSPPFQGPHKRF